MLTKVDTELLVFAKKMVTDDHIRQRALTVETAGENIPASAEEYFFELMKKESLEAFTDSLKLDKVPKEKIAFTLIAGLKKSLFSAAGVKTGRAGAEPGSRAGNFKTVQQQAGSAV
ncbi:MAG: hypothetical protein IPH68_10890 [Chitinophagaceae bacterium]|nr:hypothetical protein [Chitinophagaceae bacterium]